MTSHYTSYFTRFLRDWALVIAILVGVLGYFTYVSIHWLDSTHRVMLTIAETAQPLLIFVMLFLSFCNVSLHEIRPCRWCMPLLLIQAGVFVGIGIALLFIPQNGYRVVLEGAMICFICPTATAAAVITKRLGGNLAHIATYTIVINLVAAILIPVLVPFIYPRPDVHILNTMLIIMGKVFPLLLLPLVLALLVRRLWPAMHKRLLRYPNLPFYIWACALVVALGMTTRSIVHSEVSVPARIGIVFISLVCCLVQFWLGRKVGARDNDRITAGQALGQKNTIFAIWLGFTFFSPVTAMAGGFYCIWHNLVNSWQLYRHDHARNHHAVNQTALSQVDKIE